MNKQEAQYVVVVEASPADHMQVVGPFPTPQRASAYGLIEYGAIRFGCPRWFVRVMRAPK